MADGRPWFLTVKLPSGAADGGRLEALSKVCEEARGTVLVSAPVVAVNALEPATTRTALVIARFAFEDDLMRAWEAAPALPAGSQVLACSGLPYEGWPGHFVPTIATVHVPESNGSRAYMLVEGTGTDQPRMDDYRDIVLPMFRERGGYYVAFELGGDVRVLSGNWAEGIFALSRWPDAEAARCFWFSDRNQRVAIPTRTGAGRFEVLLTDGLAG